MSRPTTRSTSSSSPNVDNISPPTVTSPTIDQHLALMDQRLTSILELLAQPDHRHSFDSSPPPIISAPPMTPAEIETLIDSKFHATYQMTLDSFSSLSASIAALHLQHSTSPATSLSTPRPTGFFQKESKDFHVSKLIKLLELEVLHSDSLQDLEIFFDSILSHFNTVALTNDLYPRYRDLPPTFDFYRHLCQLDRTICPSSMDQAQGLANYKSSGTGLRRFLLNPKTFPKKLARNLTCSYYPFTMNLMDSSSSGTLLSYVALNLMVNIMTSTMPSTILLFIIMNIYAPSMAVPPG
jgi:hypothetical protein